MVPPKDHPSGKSSPIHLDNVSYSYPAGRAEQVLNCIDLDIRPGEYLLISGASGSGKSTLVRTLNGLIPHFYGGSLTGKITIDDRPTTEQTVTDLFDRVGLVFQNPQAQLFNRTVTQELAFGLESLGLPRTQMAARISAVAKELGIENLLDRDPQALSGGEQQLVALAAVLILRPGIVVLDEPLANLDAGHVRNLRNLLRQLCSQGIGVVVCEHRMVPTLPDAHRITLIHQGIKQLDGPPEQVLTDPGWARCGVELPLAVKMGLAGGLHPLPRGIDTFPVSEIGKAGALPAPAAIPNIHPHGPAVLEAQRLSYSLSGRKILDDIDMTLCAGQCTALVGANGAGKTTLLKLFGKLLRPLSGRILIKGEDIADRPTWEVARHLGIAFQNPNSQFFKMTVHEEILVGPIALDRHDSQWIDELVCLFKLEHLLDRAPFKLSGGEKKRVAFAAALASRPAILALDEPTAGQDGLFRDALAQGLENLQRQGTAILIVTHALNFAQRLADHWIVMAQGRMLAQGRPMDLMADARLMAQAGLEPTETFLWQQKGGR